MMRFRRYKRRRIYRRWIIWFIQKSRNVIHRKYCDHLLLGQNKRFEGRNESWNLFYFVQDWETLAERLAECSAILSTSIWNLHSKTQNWRRNDWMGTARAHSCTGARPCARASASCSNTSARQRWTCTKIHLDMLISTRFMTTCISYVIQNPNWEEWRCQIQNVKLKRPKTIRWPLEPNRLLRKDGDTLRTSL